MHQVFIILPIGYYIRSMKLQVESPILGAVEAGSGRIAVYGDSNCLDSSHIMSNCYWLLKKLLDFTSCNIRDPVIFPATNELGTALGMQDSPLPMRRDDVNFSSYSLVLGQPLRCGTDAPLAVQGTRGYKQEQREPFPNVGSKSAFSQREAMDATVTEQVVLPTPVDVNMMATSPAASGMHHGIASPLVDPMTSADEKSHKSEDVEHHQQQQGSASVKKSKLEGFQTVPVDNHKDNWNLYNLEQQTNKVRSHLAAGWWIVMMYC
jgi:hypothetical protein